MTEASDLLSVKADCYCVRFFVLDMTNDLVIQRVITQTQNRRMRSLIRSYVVVGRKKGATEAAPPFCNSLFRFGRL
jgi:hypothetical protein